MPELMSERDNSMFARSLETVLRSLASKADLSIEKPDNIEARFNALRGCNLLPGGREHRARRLTNEQIAFAVLGLATRFPAHAGFAAKILGSLVPAGGASASFFGATTLAEAVSILIEDDAARSSLKRLSFSVAEGGTNSSGFAELYYEHPDGGLKVALFVGQSATSVTGVGGEERVKQHYRHSPVSYETTLNAQFFQKLSHEIARSAFLSEPLGEGEEYDDEDARQAEYKRLGVRPRSEYLNMAVDAHVTWPKDKRLVSFNGLELVLMPRTKDHDASVHVDLMHNRLSHEQAQTVISRFLSWLSWQDDHYAIKQNGWSGNPVPVPVPKRELAFATAMHWEFVDPPALSEDALRALALYREGRNAQENFFVSYAVLNFYKIIEIANGGVKNATKNWIRDQYQDIRQQYTENPDLKRFDDQLASWQAPSEKARSAHEYIWRECRIAVAHGSSESVSDPDELPELHRLHVASNVVRWLARHAMRYELGIPGASWERGAS